MRVHPLVFFKITCVFFKDYTCSRCIVPPSHACPQQQLPHGGLHPASFPSLLDLVGLADARKAVVVVAHKADVTILVTALIWRVACNLLPDM
jgi:hypothetical protein